MNNSFPRLIDGMCATLRAEVLTRLDDEFARGQVFGVINLLNTFKVRADWSAGFLIQQIEAQSVALKGVDGLLQKQSAAVAPGFLPPGIATESTDIASLLMVRDNCNHAIAGALAWLDDHREALPAEVVIAAESLLRVAMRAEVDIELKNSSKPMFAQMSSGKEG
jgi:hypothetical protein